MMDIGHIVSLDNRNELLSRITHGKHQWTVAPDDDARGKRMKLEIVYSNPGYGGLPNEIIFSFPLSRAHMAFFGDAEEDTYVCLHPSLATGVQEGLYIEDGLLKEDFLYDFRVFFGPLFAALHRQIASCHADGANNKESYNEGKGSDD